MSTYRDLVSNVPVTVFSDVTHIKVSVSYDLGGMNYFTYNTDPRGYCLTVNPVTIKEPGADGSFGSESFMVSDKRGRRFFLEPAKRMNKKRYVELAKLLLPRATEIAALVEAGDYPEIRTLVDTTIGVTVPDWTSDPSRRVSA